MRSFLHSVSDGQRTEQIHCGRVEYRCRSDPVRRHGTHLLAHATLVQEPAPETIFFYDFGHPSGLHNPHPLPGPQHHVVLATMIRSVGFFQEQLGQRAAVVQDGQFGFVIAYLHLGRHAAAHHPVGPLTPKLVHKLLADRHEVLELFYVQVLLGLLYQVVLSHLQELRRRATFDLTAVFDGHTQCFGRFLFRPAHEQENIATDSQSPVESRAVFNEGFFHDGHHT